MVSDSIIDGDSRIKWYSCTETPLSIAVMQDNKDLIILLVENGAHIDFRLGPKENWRSSLHLAAIHNKVKALKTLLLLGAWSNILDGTGIHPLYCAATHGHRDCAQALLLAQSSVEIYDEHGKRALHQACLSNHFETAVLLIDYGADLNVKNVAGNTPLHVAASRNSFECTKILLVRGANKNALNKANQPPIKMASISKSQAIADLIENFSPEDMS